MKKLLLLTSAALLALMMFSGLLMTPGTAHAASVHMQTHATALAPMHQLMPAVSCSGNGCNNTDPYATGCGNSRKFVASATVTDPVSGISAQVDLEFSTVCGTNWTEVHPTNAGGTDQCLDGVINRASGPDGGALTFSFESCAFTFINTNQVFAPDNKAQACGFVNPVARNSPEGCTAFI